MDMSSPNAARANGDDMSIERSTRRVEMSFRRT